MADGRLEKKEQVKQNIMEVLEKFSGDKLDLSYMIYKEIASVREEGASLLKYFFEESEMVESSEERNAERIFSEEEKSKYKELYRKIIDGALEALLVKNLSDDEFYKELWKFIDETSILADEKLKSFALYYLWIDVRIPYFKLEPGIRMANEEYVTICKKIIEQIKRVRFVLNVTTEQRTERASRLVSMLDRLEDDREKAVLMSQILRMNDRSDIILSKLRREKKLEEIEKEE